MVSSVELSGQSAKSLALSKMPRFMTLGFPGLRVLAIAVVFVGGAESAFAHPAPFSYLDVVFKNGGIEGTLVVHIIDVAHDLGITPPERLLENEVAERERERIGTLLTPRLMFRSDRRLTPMWTSLEVLRDDLALRLTYRISQETPGSLVIDASLFPYDPLHQTFVNIYEGGELRQQLIFNSESNE